VPGNRKQQTQDGSFKRRSILPGAENPARDQPVDNTSLDLDQLLNKIIDLALDVTKGDSCLLYLFDENTNAFRSY